MSRGDQVSRRGRPSVRADAPRRGALRVVAGTARGRRLDTPGSDSTRPTSDRVREAVFNALHSLGALEGAQVLDAFAGSGALGIEALSRGAERASFVETDGAAREVIVGNLATTGLTDRATLVADDAITELGRGGVWDLILLDPPYAFDRWDLTLAAAREALAEQGIVVVESDRGIALPDGLHPLRSRTYGGTVVGFATRAGAPS